MKDKDDLESGAKSEIHSAVASSNINLDKIYQLIGLFTKEDKVYSPEQLDFFDKVLEPLMVGLENAALEILSQNISQTTQAPPKLLKKFALDKEAPIAGPVLEFHPSVPESILLEVAKTRNDPHLQYLSRREGLPSNITSPLIVRGSKIVLANVIENESAQFSKEGVDKLVEKSALIEELAEKLAARPGLPYSVITQLVSLASDKVKAKLRKKLIARNLDVDTVVDGSSAVLDAKTFMKTRNFHSAKQRASSIKLSSRMSLRELKWMIKNDDIDGTIVVLEVMTGLSLELVGKIMLDKQHLSFIALLRAVDLDWEFVSMFMDLREKETELSWDIEVVKRMYNKLDVKLAKSILDAKRYVSKRKTN
ncbi:MAG: DUF2336 domain-containing protein [Hyphomicrobiales bacterium]